MTRVSELTWDAVARRLDERVFAILPIGAAAKQHARHLPMRTDAIQAEWLAARLAERLPALIWPTLGYGHYPAFASYAGSCSLSAPTFEKVVGEIVTGLVGFGVRGVLVVDTGISTIAPVDRALAGCGDPGRVLHLEVYGGPRFQDAARRLTGGHVGHADELETSCLLAIAPDLVVMDRAEVGLVGASTPGPLQHVDPSAANFSASGGLGDPRKASAAAGRLLLAAMIEDMATVVAQHFVI